MNLDAAIKDAQERIHRQIGQWARFAHRKVKERAATERVAMGLVTQGRPDFYWMQETARIPRSAWDRLISP